MNRKDKIKNNFSKASKTYNIVTSTQKMCAEKLINHISNREYNNILEIGAGTGYLTNLLSNKFKKSNFFINDLSFSMLNEIQLSNKNIFKFVSDAENLPFKKREFFDLITSSSVFQWFDDYENSFKNFNNILNKDGELTFAMYGENTLKELKDIFKKVIPSHKPNLKINSFSKIKSLLEKSGFAIEFSEEQEITKQFLSLTEILQHQKLSGAVNVNIHQKNEKNISKKQWINIIKEYNKEFIKNDGVIATYHMYYFKTKKRNNL